MYQTAQIHALLGMKDVLLTGMFWSTGYLSDDKPPIPAAGLMRDLILAEDPARIAQLEAAAKITQPELVDDLIERTIAGIGLPQFVGHKGATAERLAAVRALYHDSPEFVLKALEIDDTADEGIT
jgi:hypothetical protein